jgi:RNA polymerase sigma-70 factor (ECF subfamily)
MLKIVSLGRLALRMALAAEREPAGAPACDWDVLRRTCLREAMTVLRHPDDAEEAAQEALLRSWRNVAQCRGDEIGAWTRQIGRNEALRLAARRTRRRLEVPTGEVPETGVFDCDLERVPLIETVRGALRQMTTADQLLIRLRYTEDLTQPQLAEVLDLPEGTVKVRLHRARARMRELLAEAA